jgi:CheY-like chemotaxis protein
LARTVLLADDSVTAQNMGRRILIDAGYDVVTVNNGSAALKRVHESRPDLIVLDVYMPGYGGLEVCQRLKESDETAKIPILLTVGKMEPFKTDEAKRARADGHIIKPFEASELLAALTRLEDRIVPQAEPSRARKMKSEKKNKPSRTAFDPAMSYDDAHSEKIAYLEQVKQKNANGQPAEQAQESFVEEEIAPQATKSAETSEMPRPMSVYAAEALRELPVMAESAPASGEEQGYQSSPQEETGLAHPADAEAKSESAVTAPDNATESAEIANASVGESQYEAAGENQPGAAEVAAVQLTESVETAKPSSAESALPMASATKSRWVAENVAVSTEEAALELDREMQRTQAIAADARSAAATPDQKSTNDSWRNGLSRHDSSQHDSSQQTTAEFAETASEAASAPAPEHTETDGATFAAAAAAAGSSADAVSNVPAARSPSESEPPVASEAAAAWQNWQHIRDSVMGSQTAVQLSESVAEAVQSSTAEAPAQETSKTSTPSDSPSATQESQSASEDSDSAALSSIVDSVLAELKPKLMAEISKKLKK